MKPPHNVSYLEKALRALAGTDESLVRLRRTLANVIAGQFLENEVKGFDGALKVDQKGIDAGFNGGGVEIRISLFAKSEIRTGGV